MKKFKKTLGSELVRQAEVNAGVIKQGISYFFIF
jgi:hypothetical protein